jgi:hypothetical protein
MSPKNSEYKALGLELVSIEDKSSRTPNIPLMVGENKDDGIGDPLKLLIEEALTQQRNEKRLLLCSSKSFPMSKIGRKLSVSNRK